MTSITEALDHAWAIGGHDGLCDWDGGCCAPASWALAEDCPPSGYAASIKASLAFYCDQHVNLAPRASLADVQRCTELFDPAPFWLLLLDAHPHAISIKDQ